MIKKFAVRVGSVICIPLLVFILTTADSGWAQQGKNYIISTRRSCMWALNKSTRKLMFLKYQDENTVWKSDQITVPTGIDLNNSLLIATGREGTQVFLYDNSSGLVTFYEVEKDRSIKKFVSVDLANDFK